MSYETASIMCPYLEDVKLLGANLFAATLGTRVTGSEANCLSSVVTLADCMHIFQIAKIKLSRNRGREDIIPPANPDLYSKPVIQR